MRITKLVLTFVVVLVFFVINVDLAFPQSDQELEEMTVDEELEQELRWLEAETYVITPSKIPETIKKTAASITVVTDKQIRQMGAKDLQGVIERVVPSFWLRRDVEGVQFNTRGPLYPRLLIMVNDLPVYDADYQGTYYFNHTVLSVNNIKRIEVIRGPGSALYGANAYYGVINIITKKAEDVNGVELSARGGSWDTQQYNLLFGKAFSDLEVAFNFNYLKTDGNSALIKRDVQTFIDQRDVVPYGFSPVSMAPGYTREYEEKYDLALNVKYKRFTFDGGYINRQWNHPFDYGNWKLLEKSTWLDETYRLNLGYETTLWDRLDLSAKAYNLLKDSTREGQYEPPGWVDVYYSGSFGTIWPEGQNYIYKFKLNRVGMELQATYKMSMSNTFVIGVTYEKQKLYDEKLWTDNEYLWASDELIQLPSMQVAWSPDPEKNEFKALFSEDVWDITEDLRLTLGAHYIDYSSFGSHFSPRAGLTWEYIKGYDLKLLYGHAFSIPSITDAYFQLPGTILGPQTIDTYEISLGAEFTPSFESRITFFQNDEKDLLYWQYPSESDDRSGWVNHGERRSRGVEIEARYDFGRGTYIAGNYSYTSVEDDDPEIAPRVYLGKIMSNIRLSRFLNLYVDCRYIGGWNEETRFYLESAAHRTIVNATLIARKFLKGYEGLEIRGSVYNLFDEEWMEYIGGVVSPDGWPQPGRNFLVEVRYKF